MVMYVLTPIVILQPVSLFQGSSLFSMIFKRLVLV